MYTTFLGVWDQLSAHSLGTSYHNVRLCGGCQNYGPFLGPYYNTGPNTGPSLGDPKKGP